MKADIIDIFVDGCGWVLGKASLFALAIAMGIGMGAVALAAGTFTGGGGFGFARNAAPIYGHLIIVCVLLPLAVGIFWTGMWFVRSENTGVREWGIIAAVQALLVTGGFCTALPGGWLPQLAAWSLAIAMPAMLGAGLWSFQQWRVQRWAAGLIELQAINAARRAELKAKFGTESAGSQELGIG